MSARPAVYYHKVKGKPLGFQRQDAEAVRKRSRAASKAAYRDDPQKVKAINAEWQRAHPEQRSAAVRKSRLKNLTKSLKRERASWKKRRTPELLARMREYSRLWRLRKRGTRATP
ncbi:protein of unknown function [Nitrospira defluvii]|jgi:hypothetical protein|uniref:Uncharacterized protein n=1 Tax=Nitrospira defluvii TaxID=330214 RepID=D8P9P7_9BACT|nr:protein of unknown function [Nitrospira defluvii]